MEVSLLPAFRLHMHSYSFTHEQWPEGKQHLPFPAIPLCSVHLLGKEQEVSCSFHFSVDVWVLDSKTGMGFPG